jgi:hypothetical protein
MEVMKATLTWPTLLDSHQWLTTALEKDLLECNQTPEELRAEAQRVRAEVPDGDAEIHKAFFMYAANLELVAAERQAAQAA